MDEQAYAKTTLPNGIRVITERMPNVRSVAMGLWVGVGSSHEEPSLRGISHCIEHMLFKGTRARSAREIAELMDSVGGHLNAFTDKESTCYHARVADTQAALALEVVCDMFMHSVFDQAELRKEKQVILEEIRMYDDSPDEVSQDLFLKSVWSGSSLGEPTIGYAETVSSITRDSILSYMAEKYASGAVVVTAAGNVDHDDFADRVERLLGAMPAAACGPDSAAPQFQPVSVIRQKDCEQVYILMGAEGTSASDDRRYILSVLDAILGGGMASRLFQEIREKRGLAYSVFTSHNLYRTAGLFAISASTQPKNSQAVINLIYQELQRLSADGISREELARAKEHLKGNLLLSLESTSSRMLRLGRYELSVGRHITVSEITSRIDAVTKEQVDGESRVMFGPDRTALTVLGRVDSGFEPRAVSLAGTA